MKKILLAVAIILFGIVPALADGTYGGGNKRSGGREDYAALAGTTYGSSTQIYTAWGASPNGAEYNRAPPLRKQRQQLVLDCEYPRYRRVRLHYQQRRWLEVERIAQAGGIHLRSLQQMRHGSPLRTAQ